jgi:hypothetical protein
LVTTRSINVLPLVSDIHARRSSGWVSYDQTVSDSPDVEIICGGVNEKPNLGAALWREGHLLHFGFEQSPMEMNATGCALLVNSIAYIAHFRQDRAICRAPSPFAGVSIRARSSLERWLNDEETPLSYFTAAIVPKLLDGIPADREVYRAWFRAHREWLHPTEGGKLDLDLDAQALNIAYGRPEMFGVACAALSAGGERAQHASALLARYVPDGPDVGSSAEVWRAWIDKNRPYLFFSEWGGYRWYLDLLAQRRKVPSAELLGPKRAD